MSSAVLDKAMTEDELLQAVTQALTLYKWRWCHYRRSDKALLMGHAGFPDLVAVRRDRLLMAELKGAKGRLTPEQRVWLTDLQTVAYHLPAGHVVPESWLVNPANLDIFLDSIR